MCTILRKSAPIIIYYYYYRPFPFITPVSITCTHDDFIRINGDDPVLSQLVCLKVIAVRENGYNGTPELSFYALTAIDNHPLSPVNESIPIVSNICRISISTEGIYKTFTFRYIPTAASTNYEAQFLQYCSPLINVQWSPIKSLPSPTIYVLELDINRLIVEGFIPPIITFSFPILDTLEDRLELEELAANRHHCTLIPCTDFIVCPATMFEPTNNVPQHKHCTNNQCVRFFEENFD